MQTEPATKTDRNETIILRFYNEIMKDLRSEAKLSAR